MKVTKVYVLESWSLETTNLTDKEFIKLAEKEGKIYTLNEFQNAFHNKKVSTSLDMIRFITTEYSLKDDLIKICERFDEQLTCFTTDYIIDENEDGKCSIEVNTISDEDLEFLRKIYYDLENIVESL